MRKPNFFIVGAPKCGTTSLAFWLRGHPEIYMPEQKEPHFFNTDENFGMRSLAQYEQLFAGANSAHKAVGEASVTYLFSRAAIPNILRYTKDPRVIVCLRNPVDMAYSMHGQHIYNGFEHVLSFEEAWRLSDRRLAGEAVIKRCPEPRHLAYASYCCLGAQLERLLEQVCPERVLTVVLDDLRSKPRQEYLRILEFLQVSDDGRDKFPVLNTASERRSWFLHGVTVAGARVKRRLGIGRRLGVHTFLQQANRRSRPRAPMPPTLRRELQAYFAEDVAKLRRLLNRDLSAWSEA